MRFFAEQARELDRGDPLARFRAEFHLPAGQIYLDGNSLGPLSRRAEESLQQTIAQWRGAAIGGWTSPTAPWLTMADTAAEKVAPLVGALPEEIAITGQTTANLHQLLATLFDAAEPSRRILVGDSLNFASDTYALQSHLRLRGLNPQEHLRLIPSRDGRILEIDDILAAFTDEVQIAVLPAVIFTSGQLLDVATFTRKAHERGIILGWDLSHSIGALPHQLDRDGVDFAFWCHYKWLNAGPGAVGGMFLNRRHFHREPGLAGWWGVRPERRFAMVPVHERAPGAAALQIGTPHVLSLAPLLGSLEIVAEAGGIGALRTKSLTLTDYLIAGIEPLLGPLGFRVVTPRAHSERGGHVALSHPEAWRICQALKATGIVGDFRAPDLIRLAPAPLYTSFADCAEAIIQLQRLWLARAHEDYPAARSLVT